MKPIRFHPAVLREMSRLDFSTREELVGILDALARGVSLGMPVSRPLSAVAQGVSELRLRRRNGKLNSAARGCGACHEVH
jgi:hypothetical protein